MSAVFGLSFSCRWKLVEWLKEAMGLLADNFDDVLESVLKVVEEAINTDESETRLEKVEKTIASLENKRNKLTDMWLDDKISKDAYKVIVGGINADGRIDPCKITFVLKNMEKACITDAKNRIKKVVNE